MILSITGPSGVGKTTLAKNLLAKLPQAETLEDFTTRAPRPTDEAFIYVSDEEFDAMLARNEFLWTANPHGKRYGTRKVAIDLALETGLYIPILVIPAVVTLHEYAKSTDKGSQVHSLYIHIDDEAELRRRATKRGDLTQEEIEDRIAECRSWNQEAQKSGMPFIYLDGKKSPEELLKEALHYLDSFA